MYMFHRRNMAGYWNGLRNNNSGMFVYFFTYVPEVLLFFFVVVVFVFVFVFKPKQKKKLKNHTYQAEGNWPFSIELIL